MAVLENWRDIQIGDDALPEPINEIATAVKQVDAEKISKNNPEFTGVVKIGDTILEQDEYGDFVITKPTLVSEVGIDNGSVTVALFNGTLEVNGNTVYHDGNLKNLTKDLPYPLTEYEKELFMSNTGLDETLGDIESALDGIIAMQNKLIGGDA